MYYGHFCTVG